MKTVCHGNVDRPVIYSINEFILYFSSKQNVEYLINNIFFEAKLSARNVAKLIMIKYIYIRRWYEN